MRLVLFEPDRWARFLYPKTLAFLAILTVVLIIVSILVRSRASYALDLKATLGLQRSSSPFWDVVMRWFTFMGNSLTLMILAVGSFIICYVAQDLRAATFVAISLIGLPLNVALKNSFTRQRPGEEEVKVHPGLRWGFSYPSGHAMGSTAFYGFLATIVFLHAPNDTIRALLMAPFILMPLFIGASRIYMGAHWLSDVIGGITGGVIVVMMLAILYPV